MLTRPTTWQCVTSKALPWTNVGRRCPKHVQLYKLCRLLAIHRNVAAVAAEEGGLDADQFRPARLQLGRRRRARVRGGVQKRAAKGNRARWGEWYGHALSHQRCGNSRTLMGGAPPLGTPISVLSRSHSTVGIYICGRAKFRCLTPMPHCIEGAAVVIVGTTPAHNTATPVDDATVVQLNVAAAALAKESGLQFIDLHTPLIKECGPVPWQDTGPNACQLCAPNCKGLSVHYGPAGYSKIAGLIWASVSNATNAWP